jgi:hypothetical protein
MYFGPLFKYGRADWVKERGFPEHHLRIIRTHTNPDGQRWYLIWDTTLQRGYADYDWREADQLETKSELVKSADSDAHASLILGWCQQLTRTPYSIPQRLDCESLQRYVQSAREEDWSPQVWKAIGVGALLIWLFGQGE